MYGPVSIDWLSAPFSFVSSYPLFVFFYSISRSCDVIWRCDENGALMLEQIRFSCRLWSRCFISFLHCANCVIRTQWEVLNYIQFPLTLLWLLTLGPDEERDSIVLKRKTSFSPNRSLALSLCHKLRHSTASGGLITLAIALLR